MGIDPYFSTSIYHEHLYEAYTKRNCSCSSILLGIDATTYFFIGIIEIISLVLFLIPRTGIIGTLLIASYMGGAIATHLQHHQPIAMAVIIQILLWITAFIRFPELKERLLSIKK